MIRNGKVCDHAPPHRRISPVPGGVEDPDGNRTSTPPRGSAPYPPPFTLLPPTHPGVGPGPPQHRHAPRERHCGQRLHRPTGCPHTETNGGSSGGRGRDECPGRPRRSPGRHPTPPPACLSTPGCPETSGTYHRTMTLVETVGRTRLRADRTTGRPACPGSTLPAVHPGGTHHGSGCTPALQGSAARGDL